MDMPVPSDRLVKRLQTNCRGQVRVLTNKALGRVHGKASRGVYPPRWGFGHARSALPVGLLLEVVDDCRRGPGVGRGPTAPPTPPRPNRSGAQIKMHPRRLWQRSTTSASPILMGSGAPSKRTPVGVCWAVRKRCLLVGWGGGSAGQRCRTRQFWRFAPEFAAQPALPDRAQSVKMGIIWGQACSSTSRGRYVGVPSDFLYGIHFENIWTFRFLRP